MLWDLIRDFFVQHVFGGTTSEDYLFQGVIGVDQYNGFYYNSNNVYFTIGNGDDGLAQITLGDYLSTTATAITITIIVVICFLFIWKMVKLVGGLLR